MLKRNKSLSEYLPSSPRKHLTEQEAQKAPDGEGHNNLIELDL